MMPKRDGHQASCCEREPGQDKGHRECDGGRTLMHTSKYFPVKPWDGRCQSQRAWQNQEREMGKLTKPDKTEALAEHCFMKVLVDCAELSLKGLMPVICWTIGVSYYWPCKHWQACPLECWQNGGGQTGGSVLEVQSTYVEWKNDHCHSCSSGLAIWKAICIFVCKWSCLEFWSLPGNCPVRLKERAGFYLEACVPGTCFKGRINLSKTLWAEISGEECMLTAERSQESVRFQKQILFCDSHWSWLLHTLDYFCVSWSHQELENFRWCQKIPWGLKMKIQARKAEELMETM